MQLVWALRLRAKYRRMQRAPKGRLPIEMRVGCARPPAVWADTPEASGTMEEASAAWAAYARALQHEVLGYYDIVDPSRHQGLDQRVSWTRVSPPVPMAPPRLGRLANWKRSELASLIASAAT